MAMGLLILITILAGAILGFVASLITEDEKEIYEKYFKYFLILLIILIPLMFFLNKELFLLVLFLLFVLLCWNYTDQIFKFFRIKRHKKKK